MMEVLVGRIWSEDDVCRLSSVLPAPRWVDDAADQQPRCCCEELQQEFREVMLIVGDAGRCRAAVAMRDLAKAGSAAQSRSMAPAARPIGLIEGGGAAAAITALLDAATSPPMCWTLAL